MTFNPDFNSDRKVKVEPDNKILRDHLDKRETAPTAEGGEGSGNETWLMTRYIERVKEFDVVDKVRKREEN